MYIKSAQTELVVMATQYMTKQERTGTRYKHVALVTDPMTFVRHYDFRKKITSVPSAPCLSLKVTDLCGPAAETLLN